MNGFLCLLKPPGMTSSQAVLRVRRKLPRGTKAGHAGTLDPEASGVLPVMIGKATRLFDLVADKEKTYEAQWIPGVDTDTQDIHGEVLRRAETHVDRAQLEAALPSFLGEISQVPPMYSALKRDGKRLYELAREGRSLELEPRKIRIDEIRVLGPEEDEGWRIRVRCGRGTYIRTLCRDIGAALGVPACMGRLVRTQCGPFSIGDALAPERLEEPGWERAVMPMDGPLMKLPAIVFPAEAEKAVRCGNPIERARVCSCGAAEGETARLYLSDRFCGIGRLERGLIRFDAMLLE